MNDRCQPILCVKNAEPVSLSENFPKYKGKDVTYDDYLDIYEERGERIQKGKKPNSIGLFSGWGTGTLKKPYE